MGKIKIATFREVENPDGKIKLPQDLTINLPAEKISKNDRKWEDVSNGVKASNRAIERGVPVLYMYLGHPCWDDPVVTGMLPVARLTKLVENSDTSVDFYATMEYGKPEDLNRTALFVGGALAAGAEIDCSIRAAAETEWSWDGLDKLSIPEGDYPLVIDFLPPDQQPGIAGTKVTQVSRWESAARKIKENFSQSILFKELIDDFIKSFKLEIQKEKTSARANATGRKEIVMPVAKEMSADVLKQIEELPDKESIVIFIKGMLSAMGVKDDKAVDDMNKMDEEPAEADYGDDETGKESFKRAKSIWECKINSIVPAVEKAVAAHKKVIEKTPKVENKTPQQETAQPIKEKPVMTEQEKRREAAYQRLVDEALAKEEAAERLLNIAEKKEKAITDKSKFYGHEIWDQERYPQVLLDKALEDCSKECKTETEMKIFLSERLDKITKQVKLEAFNKAHLPGKQYLERSEYVGNGGWVGEQDEINKIAAERILPAFENYVKSYHPKVYNRLVSAKSKEDRKQAAEAKGKSWGRTYREDFIANGSSNNTNFAALMTAIGMLKQWIPSPLLQLAQRGPALNLLPLRASAGGNGMPMGEFIEITSSYSPAPANYDLGYKQVATDGLRQIEFFSKPYQYFARWRERELVTNKDTLYWLGLDPWKRDLQGEGIFWLFNYLMKETELILSAENIRGNLAYASTAITNETLNLAQADHFKVFGVGEDRVVQGLTVSNAVGYFKLRRGQAANTVTLKLGPIVPPGINPFIERNIPSDVEAYPVELAAIGGKTQVRGMYDPIRQKGVRINDSGPEPTFFVMDHVGIVVALEGSNFDGVNATVVNKYATASNVSRFDCTLQSGETNQIKSNQLAELLIFMMAELRRLRQVDVEEIDYLIGATDLVEGLLPIGSHFQGQDQLDFAAIGPGMTAKGQYSERLRNMFIHGTTDPFYSDLRLLTMGMSKTIVYSEYAPPMLGDLLTCGKINNDGKLVRTHQQAQSIVTRELIATIPTSRDPRNDKPGNFGCSTVYIENPPASTGLPA